MSEKAADVQDKLYTDEKLGTTTYKCPNCGGDAEFDPKEQAMRCLYCDSVCQIDDNGTVTENDLSELLKDAKVWDEAEVYQCQSCGAKEIIDKQEVALVCPFCGTNNVIKTEELPGLKPHGVVPFKLDNAKAETIATNWAKRKYYAPRDFKKSVKAENIHGIYNPVFTFDADTQNTYEGRLGKHYTTTSYVNGRPVHRTNTRYFSIKGSLDVKFDDFIVQASSNMSLDNIRAIEPFKTNDAPKYKPDYLRGYSASTYNKSGSACWDECKKLMSARIEKKILSKYDYDVKSYLNVKTAFLKQKYKYVLVPVYVGHYKYKNKLYNFFINGESGRITGKTPVSGWKVFFTVLFCIAIVVGIALLSYFT